VLLDLSFSSASSGAGSHAACGDVLARGDHLASHSVRRRAADYASGSMAPGASWLRLARAARSSNTAVVLMTRSRVAGGQADVALELRAGRPQFSGRPLLLEGLESQATAVRNRSGPIGGSTALRFRLPP
jgi:hypothetical protein